MHGRRPGGSVEARPSGLVDESDRLPADQPAKKIGRLVGEPLDGLARVHALRGIDSDQADAGFLAIEADDHGVTVDDAHDLS